MIPWLVVLLPLNAWWVGQIECIRYWSSPTMLSLFYNVVFLLAVVIGANGLLRWVATHFRRLGGLDPLGRFVEDRLVLSSGHLVVVYVALCTTSAMASLDCFQLQTVAMTHWKAHATAENQWAQLFHPLVPRDLVVDDPVALKNIVQGGTSLYRPENYRPWIVPSLWWASYAGAVWLVTLCMASLFRRRWLESERLQFPIIQVPLEMLDPKTRLWRDGAMWAAATIVFVLQASNALHSVSPRFPLIPFKLDETPALNIGAQLKDKPWSNVGLLYFSLYPFAIGLAYLLPAELVFSTVVFWWIYKAQFVFASWMGWEQIEGVPYADEQMLGGYLALGVASLWMARRHFARVIATVRGSPEGYDDRDEPWPYRTQACLLGAGLAYCLWFAVAKTHMAWWVAPVFLGMYFVLSLAVMRIRAEMGIPAHDLLVKGPVQSIPRIVGTTTRIGDQPLLPKETLASFALHRFYNRGYRGHVAPHQIEAFKFADREGVDTRGLFNLMWVLLPVGALLTFWSAAGALYTEGADAKAAPNNIFYGNEPWDELTKRLLNPQGFSRARSLFAIGGLLCTLLMTAGHTRITSWPIHPLGYALGNCWAVHWLWGPLTIGWVWKTITLRYGGDAAYRRGRSVAIGLILGDMFAGGFWDLLGLWRRRLFLRIWS